MPGPGMQTVEKYRRFPGKLWSMARNPQAAPSSPLHTERNAAKLFHLRAATMQHTPQAGFSAPSSEEGDGKDYMTLAFHDWLVGRAVQMPCTEPPQCNPTRHTSPAQKLGRLQCQIWQISVVAYIGCTQKSPNASRSGVSLSNPGTLLTYSSRSLSMSFHHSNHSWNTGVSAPTGPPRSFVPKLPNATNPKGAWSCDQVLQESSLSASVSVG